ncbi:predicted protein [Sclerotinia sclerotiorum 1980 UF-70]|uniref:Uncharacterized protein n=1 Tax=Sclerotinia sclerotiorum (strain ATCC 18683 / 1980 / Ss-1) TaxID=665079 RepID=A7F901_SCLS1|nr:predicted protein [Sclerotinia sclerotiorum 1980 UF-70]EDN99222.1 predicted protein [Sclerotinia sclerotiorum 1980 UF-70]
MSSQGHYVVHLELGLSNRSEYISAETIVSASLNEIAPEQYSPPKHTEALMLIFTPKYLLPVTNFHVSNFPRF